MITENFKTWWRKYDDVEKCRLIKEKAYQVNRYHKLLVKAQFAEHAYGFNRSGTRGGKFTTLVSRTQNATDRYLVALEELKYMVGTM